MSALYAKQYNTELDTTTLVVALLRRVPSSLFPLLLAPTKYLLLCVKGCPFRSATALFTPSNVVSFVPSVHTHAHTGYHCGLKVTPSCPEYYYTDPQKIPNKSFVKYRN
ncbi:ras-related protein Rab-8A [Platysternon megacephalum]|uniref:Ras-related protein Rab-8A n=1 Tax=Platysternon megacephalum TaxID=55544 RepID=A0A4D9E7Z5_9SAUR|nr:ras-related protein Rab-8A [Platysternon megacephalum]